MFDFRIFTIFSLVLILHDEMRLRFISSSVPFFRLRSVRRHGRWRERRGSVKFCVSEKKWCNNKVTKKEDDQITIFTSLVIHVFGEFNLSHRRESESERKPMGKERARNRFAEAKQK